MPWKECCRQRLQNVVLGLNRTAVRRPSEWCVAVWAPRESDALSSSNTATTPQIAREPKERPQSNQPTSAARAAAEDQADYVEQEASH